MEEPRRRRMGCDTTGFGRREDRHPLLLAGGCYDTPDSNARAEARRLRLPTACMWPREEEGQGTEEHMGRHGCLDCGLQRLRQRPPPQSRLRHHRIWPVAARVCPNGGPAADSTEGGGGGQGDNAGGGGMRSGWPAAACRWLRRRTGGDVGDTEAKNGRKLPNVSWRNPAPFSYFPTTLPPSMQILRVLSCALVPSSLAPMHRLSSPSGSLLTSAVPACLCLKALALRISLLMSTPNQPIRSVSGMIFGNRFSPGSWNMATIKLVKGDESVRPYRRLAISSASANFIPHRGECSAVTKSTANIETDNSKGSKIIELENSHENKNIERHVTISKIMKTEKRSDIDASRTTDFVDGKHDAWNQNVNPTDCKENRRSERLTETMPRSTHRDGSIYKGTERWKREFRIADRNETPLEAMMFSGVRTHIAHQMLQIFSVELAEIRDGGLVELYGYIAVRDSLDSLLNYIVNFSRDNPILVEQGSLIKMVGPKRGIQLVTPILIEYDMRVKIDEQAENDLQLIDGLSVIYNHGTWHESSIYPIVGDCGKINLTLAHIRFAVEATVEVFITEVQNNFNLSLDCFTSGLDDKISLFVGAISESCSLKRSVIAVKQSSLMDLKFEIGAPLSTSDQYRSRFMVKNHGYDIQNIKSYFALISVKVIWSTLP